MTTPYLDDDPRDPEPCPACLGAPVRVTTDLGVIHLCPICCGDADSGPPAQPPASRAPLVAALVAESKRLRKRLLARPAVSVAARRVIARARELVADLDDGTGCVCAGCELKRALRKYDATNT